MHNNKAITATWFEVAVKAERTQPDGTIKAVKETYCIDATSFTEAERRAYDEVESFDEVLTIKRATYSEFFSEKDSSAEKFWRVKVKLITLDERTAKEKKTAVQYLVQASSMDDANRIVKEILSEGMIEFEISDTNESAVQDIFIHYKK